MHGASNHMTGQKTKFRDLDETVTGEVKFGDGLTVGIKCKNGEDRLLCEVYFIPTLCNSIISLGQLPEDGNKVILNRDFISILIFMN